MKRTRKAEFEIGQRSANENASAADLHSDFWDLRSPNQAPLPTSISVTDRADARSAPDMLAAEL